MKIVFIFPEFSQDYFITPIYQPFIFRLLNKIYRLKEYGHFCKMTEFLGVLKQVMSNGEIRVSTFELNEELT